MLDFIAVPFGYVMRFIYEGVGSYGLSIILFTLLTQIILLPFNWKQKKGMMDVQRIQPKMLELQKKYANNREKYAQEVQKLYDEEGVSPLSGCLPMLLQMPIFMALFQVLSEMGSRTSGTTYEFYNLVPSLVMRPSEALAVGFGTFVPYLILMVIFAGATFLPMVLMQMGNKDNPQRKQTMIMAAVMSVFMLWISWSSPAGVLLFWGASSLMGIAQQQISMRIMKKRDAEAAETIEVKPIEVDVTRKQKKPRPTKKDTTKRK